MIKLRSYLPVLPLVVAAGLQTGWAATDVQPEKPKVYALVAAVGEQLTLMVQMRRVGSHIAPYRGTSFTVRDNVLNVSVLRSLDNAIAEKDPDSTRILMMQPSANMDAAEKWEREDVALDEVEARLKADPERAQWDRIIVVTPAYHPYEANGLGGRLIGFGIFYQPLGRRRSGDIDAGVTPDGKFYRVSRFVAPYAFLDIWVLDAKTLTVIDRQRTYDSIKVFDPQSASIGIFDNISGEVQSKYVLRTLETSIEKAIAHSGVLNRAGSVKVGDTRKVESGKKN